MPLFKTLRGVSMEGAREGAVEVGPGLLEALGTQERHETDRLMGDDVSCLKRATSQIHVGLCLQPHL